mmetsp:Transcript_80446/g.111460  ORF Transcript_80446/g.111460 Transcript_80446/m.111460 type:complete len:186 (+) Transcript_80446:24-581(+)
MKVILPDEYPYILLCCFILCIACFMSGVVGNPRSKYFTKEFMEQFKEEHEQAFPGTEPAVGGWPDAGEGRYGQKLPFADFVDFNTSMRVHKNQVELLPLVVCSILIAGFCFPLTTLILSIIEVIAKIAWIFAYRKGGPNSRMIPGLIMFMTMAVITLLAFGGSIYMAASKVDINWSSIPTTNATL